jgi:hypothetical protein
MVYQFYPRKDAPCPSVGHCPHVGFCPHVGGAAIASLVVIGNENQLYLRQLYLRQLHGTIDAEKKRNHRLFEENEKLSIELEQVKLELKLERQNEFATNKQKQTDAPPAVELPTEKPSKKYSGRLSGRALSPCSLSL